ncbi:hypothetical protein [Pseudopedobacter sp.]|uniref:hypothetical protein n=1 Tax=Pseudopedobacter sp. TaxID=1936787 RepID=UPI00333F5291
MKKAIHFIFLSVFALIMASCDKEEVLDNQLKDKITIAQKYLPTGEQLTLYADQPLSVGYQNIYVQLTKDDTPLRTDQISFTPTMDMGSMKHGAPASSLVYNSSLDSYEAYIVFTMASGTAGSWALDLNVNNELISLPVVIKEAPTGNVPVKTFTGTDNKRYVLALIEPSAPKIGMNDLEVMLFLRETMFSFPELNYIAFDFHPEMTSMDHGSSNNQNPQGIGNGRYKGKVNFTMSGDWRLFFNVSQGETQLAQDVFLDVLF